MKCRLFGLLFLTLLFLFLSSWTSAQGKFDANWLFSGTNKGGPVKLDFRNVPPRAEILQVSAFEFATASMSMSDSLSGDLLFYSNGCKIMNRNHMIMLNGDSINPGYIQQFYCSSGPPMNQLMKCVKKPGSSNQYYLFNLDLRSSYNSTNANPIHVYYHLIDMSLHGGLGAVTEKLSISVSDTLVRGMLHATSHANGDDWWFVMPRSRSNCYYIWKVDENGVQVASKSCIGSIWTDNDDGQAVFTPNGKKYIRFNPYNGIKIFDFDAQNGILSSEVSIDLPNFSTYKYYGCAISSNSRFLYCSATDSVFQFDLDAADIGLSKTLVAVWNGTNEPFPTLFSYMSLGPDSKIYIVPPGSARSLHVIHNPDCKGVACNVEQNAIDLGAFNYWTMPNFPHYRNQPKVCDTSSGATELSGLESDLFTVYPNPSSDKITISFEQGYLEKDIISVSLFNMTGELQVLINSKEKSPLELNLEGMPSGIYTVCVVTKEGVFVRKVLKQSD